MSKTLADILYSHVYNTQDTANMDNAFMLSFSLSDHFYSFSEYDMEHNDGLAKFVMEFSVNGKVPGIKLLRAILDCGLREAKDFWECGAPSHVIENGVHKFNAIIEGESRALETFSRLVKICTASPEQPHSLREQYKISVQIFDITLTPFTNNYFTL